MRTIRSFSKYLAACSLALAVVFCASSVQAASKGGAYVTTVKGEVTYSDAAGKWLAVKPNSVLPEGATIKTGPGAYVYMAVNQKACAVRMNENTIMRLEKIEQQNNAEKDSDTVLDIRQGTVAGDVKKLSKASNFDIRTPNGLAGIRGTSWVITVTLSFGNVQLTQTSFHCVNGQVVIATTVNGQTVTLVLNEGQTVVTTNGQNVAPQVQQTDAPTTQTFQVQIGALTVTMSVVPDVITPDVPPTLPPGPGPGTGTGGEQPITPTPGAGTTGQ